MLHMSEGTCHVKSILNMSIHYQVDDEALRIGVDRNPFAAEVDLETGVHIRCQHRQHTIVAARRYLQV